MHALIAACGGLQAPAMGIALRVVTAVAIVGLALLVPAAVAQKLLSPVQRMRASGFWRCGFSGSSRCDPRHRSCPCSKRCPIPRWKWC